MKSLLTQMAITFSALTALLLLASGCTTAQPDGTKTYDAVKTAQVKAAIEPFVAGAVRRVVENSPEHAAEIEVYLRAVGSVFCSASATGEITPEQILTALDQGTAGLQAGVDPEILDVKNGLLALYRIAYAGRFKAELASEKWPYHVLDLLCNALDGALRDLGQPGCK